MIHRRTKVLSALICVLVFASFLFFKRCDGSTGECFRGQSTRLPATPMPNIELVVAKMKHEDTEWIKRHLPNWRTKIYIADDPKAELTVPVNKGREAGVFLA
jgi:hypothetical protein